VTASTAIDPATLVVALGDAASSIVPALPGMLSAGTPRLITRPSEVPDLGPDSQALVAALGRGLSGSITLAVAAPVHALLTDGPLGPQDLSAALGPVVEDFIAELARFLDLPVSMESSSTGPGELALTTGAAQRRGVTTFAVDLRGAKGQLAVLLLEVGEEEAEELILPSISPDEIAKEALTSGGGGGASIASLELLADVEMSVTAELGRSRMTVRHLLELTVGSVVELDRSADSAVDLFVNGTLIARGEVVIIDEEFGVRVTEIVNRTPKR